MKKLIAILVVFALVMGAAFAQPNIGGQLMMGLDLVTVSNAGGDSWDKAKTPDGYTADDTQAMSGGLGIKDATGFINVGFGDEEAGGKFRLFNVKHGAPGHFDFFAFAWIKPSDMLRIQMGQNPDGDWGFAEIVGWGFTAEAKAVGVAVSDYAGAFGKADTTFPWSAFLYEDATGALVYDESKGPNWATEGTLWSQGDVDWGYGLATKPGFAGIAKLTNGAPLFMYARENAFYGGMNGRSVNFEITPTDALQINLGLNFGGGPLDLQTQLMADLHLNFKFAIDGIGTVKFAFQGGPGLGKQKKFDKYAGSEGENVDIDLDGTLVKNASPGDIYLAFALSAIENVAMEIGFGLDIPGKRLKGDAKDADDMENDDPTIKIGYGLHFTGDGFGVKARLGANIMDNTKKYSESTGMIISFGLLPYFAVGDNLTLFIHAGFGMLKFDAKWDGKVSEDNFSVMDWFINPYVEAPVGALKLYAGLQLSQFGIADWKDAFNSGTNFGINVGFNAYF